MTDDPIPAGLSAEKLRHSGTAQRRRELALPPAGPWRAVVTVDAVSHHGRRSSSIAQDWVFEVCVAWHGPPALGMPESREPVDSQDVYVVTTLEDALRLARRAHEAFREPEIPIEPPDLRRLAASL
jgi:hypothetical protein